MLDTVCVICLKRNSVRQCFGSGFIESESGSSISSEFGSGSRVLMTKIEKKNS
jgi:hypothetical protein